MSKEKADLGEFIEGILKEIHEAEELAYLKGIETNSIILNKNHAHVKEFYLRCQPSGAFDTVRVVPPMIMGKTLFLGSLPEQFDYALTYVPTNKEEEENLICLLQKYVKVIGQGENEQLVFKGISTKRNKEDFRIIKEKLGLWMTI